MLRNALVSVLVFVASSSATRADVIVTGFAEGSIRHYLNDGTQLGPITSGTVFGASGMTIGPDGNLYVSTQTGYIVPGAPDSVFKINPYTGTVTPFIDLGVGYFPGGLKFGPDGNLYVSKSLGQSGGSNGTVDKFNGTTGAALGSVVTGLSQPTGLVFRGNNLYISNQGSASVSKWDGTTTTTFVSPGSGGLAGPAGLLFGPGNDLYVVDLFLGAVRRYNGTSGASNGDFIAAGGALLNQFPSDLLFDESDSRALVASLGASFTDPDPALHGNVKAFNGTTGAFTGNFALDILGASQILQFTPVPEPTSLMLVGAAAAGFTWWKRRR